MRTHAFPWHAWPAILLFAAMASSGATINFERINEAVPFEGMGISNQFEPYYGITFRGSTNAGSRPPEIARVGDPNLAFSRAGSAESDTPLSSTFGTYFLHDGGGELLVLDFTTSVSQASGYVIDIDSNERVVVSAYADATSTNALDSRVFNAGDPGTGDGVGTFWSFSRPTNDIRRIEIVRNGPVGFDLFSSNYTPPPARAATVGLRMHPGLTIVGDRGRPYRIEYADRVDRGLANTNWHLLTTLFLPGSPYLFHDLSAGASSQRYYRAVAVP
jgi:hypothetical protein